MPRTRSVLFEECAGHPRFLQLTHTAASEGDCHRAAEGLNGGTLVQEYCEVGGCAALTRVLIVLEPGPPAHLKWSGMLASNSDASLQGGLLCTTAVQDS